MGRAGPRRGLTVGAGPGGGPGLVHLLEPGSDGWTLLLLHATGGDERQLMGLGRTLGPTAARLSPRGTVMENGVTRRWFRRFGPTDLDLDDMRARGDDLAAFVREAAATHGLDPDRILAVGYSNGANVAVDLLLRHPRLLRGAVLLRPLLPYRPETTPDLGGRDVLVAAGAADPWAPEGVTAELAEVLRAGGAAVTVRRYPAGHEITAEDVADATRWVGALTGSA